MRLKVRAGFSANHNVMSAYHAAAVLVLGRALQVVAGLCTLRLATTFLSPAQFGSVNQVMSLATLGTAAVLLPASAYIMRALLEWKDAGILNAKLLSYLSVVISLGPVFGLLAWFMQERMEPVSGISALWVGTLVALYAVGYSVHVMGSSGLNMLGHRGLYIFFGNLAAWGGLLFAIGLSHTGGGAEKWLLGIYGGFILSCPSYWFLLRRCRSNAKVTTEPLAMSFDGWTLFSFVWPQTLVFILWWIQSQSYRFIVSNVADVAQVGLFATAYMICSVPMQTFESIFNELYSPEFFRGLKGQGTSGMTSAWNAYAAAYIPAVILFGFFLMGNSTFLVQLLLGPQFHTIAPILFLPALTETFRAISSSLHQLGLAKVDMSVSLIPVSVAAIIAPVLVYWFASYEPLLGTAIGLMLAALAAFLLVLPASHRALPVTWPVRRISTAIVWGLILLTLGKLLYLLFPKPAPQEAVVCLLVSGSVMAAIQYGFAKKWMRRLSPSMEAAA